MKMRSTQPPGARSSSRGHLARARGEVFALAGGKAVVARERDHRGIVGAKLRAREEGACAGRGELARQHLAQPPVCADAAGNDEVIEAGSPQRAQRFRDQRGDDRFLEAARHVGARDVVEHAPAHGDDDRRLEPAEAEIEAGPIEHGSRELEHAKAPMLGEGRECGPARISEAEQLRRLVEGLARGVILGLPQDPVAPYALDVDQEGMSSGYLQRHEREVRRARLEGGRQQVAFQVVDPDDRHAPGIAERAPEASTDQQRPDEARSRRIGNAVNGLRLDARLGQGRLDHRQEALDVLARGELRHHPAVAAVQLDLAEDAIRHEAFFAVVERNRRLVAGGFDA
jgi:hypothetical protein